jgi:(S)-ureidoglycine aminohydrolase
MERAKAIVHFSPAIGARFTQYTLELEAEGILHPAETQRFVFVLDGEITLEAPGLFHNLKPNGYAYLPPQAASRIIATQQSRLEVIEKPYIPCPGSTTPNPLLGNESEVNPQPLMGDSDLLVRSLLPEDAGFNFAVNTMEYKPGAALSMVEVHVMEHGLLMLEGGGIYRLDEQWYPVTAGDFIWMAPYCPQWFGALGKKPAKYLIYKDWNRAPLL